MARYLRITTPYGDSYFIHENGNIERGDGHNGGGSPSWTFQGITLASGHGGFIPFHRLTPDVIDGLKSKSPSGLCHAKGTPVYTGVDNDHGTRRVWGNTDHHGIKDIQILDRTLTPVQPPRPLVRRVVVKLEIFDNDNGTFDVVVNDETCGTYPEPQQVTSWARAELRGRMSEMYGAACDEDKF